MNAEQRTGEETLNSGEDLAQDLPHDLSHDYALGVLEGDALASFEAALKVDANLQVKVDQWHGHFAALGMDVASVKRPNAIFAHLKRELWSENRLPWRRRLRIWEFALGGIAAALLAYWLAQSTAAELRARDVFSAEIRAEQSAYRLTAALQSGTAALLFEQSQLMMAPGKVLQLWLLDEKGSFHSLGVLPEALTGSIALSAAQVNTLQSGARLVLSEEEQGGSISGTPANPLRGIGAVVRRIGGET